MSEALEKLRTAHHKAMKARTVEICEGLTAHVEPLTLDVLDRIRAGDDEDDSAMAVNTILHRALDAEGNRLFGDDERQEIRRLLGLQTLSDVAEEINEDLIQFTRKGRVDPEE